MRNHAGGEDVALEDFGIAGQAVDTLLDTGTARIVEADDGSTHLHGLVKHFADLVGDGFGQGASGNGEVLRIDEDETSVYSAVAGDHAVGERSVLLHAEVVAAVGGEHVEFFKTALVQKFEDAFPCGVLALGVLLFDALFAAGHTSFLTEFQKLVDFFLHCHVLLIFY